MKFKICGRLPWRSSGEESTILQGAGLPSLFGELRSHKPHGTAQNRNRKYITFFYPCFVKNNRMTQVASPGNKYFNFCFIFMMTNNFQVYFLFLNTKLNHKQVQPRHFISHLHTPIGSSSNLLTTDQASAKSRT